MTWTATRIPVTVAILVLGLSFRADAQPAGKV
jgi:hypothetical protein